MPVLSDFVLVVGDDPVTIGDGNPTWEATFHTGGRRRDHPALLVFNVRHLTHTKRDVPVRINEMEVGRIHNYYPGGPGVGETNVSDPAKHRQQDHYYTQMIAMNGERLNDGTNEIEIDAVDFPGNSGSNKYDDFNVKDLVCFFHQSA
jgi:hypothetical protein